MENQAVTPRTPAEPDRIDAKLQVWGRELPGLDLEIEGIVERIYTLQRFLERTATETLEAHSLTFGEWRLMGHLRYTGAPYHGKPGKLAEALGLSSGAMTNRLDAMERRELVRRLPDPDDRRGVIVELTETGHRLWETTVETQAEKEALVASALDDQEKRELNALLRRLMHAFYEHHGHAATRAKQVEPEA